MSPTKAVMVIVLGMAGVLLLLVSLMALTPVLVARELIGGIYSYPAAVLPRIRPEKGAIVMAVLALSGTAIGFHYSARWLCTAMRGTQWQVRWTVAAMLAFVLTFAVAVDVAAVVHQTAWIARAPAKTIVYDRYRDGPGHNLGLLCHGAASQSRFAFNQHTLDRWEIEIVRKPDGAQGGVVLRARDPRDPMAGRIFTCDGRLDEARVAAYIAAIESGARP